MPDLQQENTRIPWLVHLDQQYFLNLISRCHQSKQWWFLMLRALGGVNPLDFHRARYKKVFQIAGHMLYLHHFMHLEDSANLYINLYIIYYILYIIYLYNYIIIYIHYYSIYSMFPWCHPSPCTPRYKTVGELGIFGSFDRSALKLDQFSLVQTIYITHMQKI